MIKKILKVVAIVLVLAFIVGQFVRPDFSNPPVVEGETIAAGTQMPADVQQVLNRSCKDCHSNETAYPWYSKITPFNWYLADHIAEGRHELNFSVFNTYKPEKKARKLRELCEQVEKQEMPLPSYLWIHWDAGLSAEDSKLLCNWAKAESERIEASAPAS